MQLIPSSVRGCVCPFKGSHCPPPSLDRRLGVKGCFRALLVMEERGFLSCTALWVLAALVLPGHWSLVLMGAELWLIWLSFLTHSLAPAAASICLWLWGKASRLADSCFQSESVGARNSYLPLLSLWLCSYPSGASWTKNEDCTLFLKKLFIWK